jgi:hypothetical protein
MGMTDRQFDSYKAQVLLILERVQDEIGGKGKSPTLDSYMANLQSELKKP